MLMNTTGCVKLVVNSTGCIKLNMSHIEIETIAQKSTEIISMFTESVLEEVIFDIILLMWQLFHPEDPSAPGAEMGWSLQTPDSRLCQCSYFLTSKIFPGFYSIVERGFIFMQR